MTAALIAVVTLVLSLLAWLADRHERRTGQPW